MEFLTPRAALLVVVAALPVAAFLWQVRREDRVRRGLRLDTPRRRVRYAPLVALIAVAVLLAIAATQPVVDLTRTRPERTDAQAVFVIDISRSMLAKRDTDADDRLTRAKRHALRFRDELGALPVGLASITDRTLPYLFPTADRRVFATTLALSVGIERPPPAQFYEERATQLGTLADVVNKRYFLPGPRKRLLVVFTDGETLPVPARLATALQEEPRVHAVFVHTWHAEERVFAGSLPEAYRPDPASGPGLERLALTVGGAEAFTEDELGDAIDFARAALGEGSERAVVEEQGKVSLMPAFALAAIVPLAFLLTRRNF